MRVRVRVSMRHHEGEAEHEAGCELWYRQVFCGDQGERGMRGVCVWGVRGVRGVVCVSGETLV